jgi:hypothetical protein
MSQHSREVRKLFRLVTALHMPWPMHTPLRCDNSREGGEGISDWLMPVAVKAGVQELSTSFERPNPITQF